MIDEVQLEPEETKIMPIDKPIPRTVVEPCHFPGAAPVDEKRINGDAYFFRLNATVGYYSAPDAQSRILCVRSWYPGMLQKGMEH